MKPLKRFFERLSRGQRALLLVLSGLVVGGGLLFLYMLRFTTYLGDDPAACVNCHIMAPYYVTWDHSSHARNATCNDCHVPQQNALRKYAFKGVDGMKHLGAFLLFAEPQAPAAKTPSSRVIMDNCIRCHTELNTELVKSGKIDYMMARAGEGKACWDCHRQVPHGRRNGLSTTPAAQVPYPESPTPEWLKNAIKKQ